MKISVFGTGYVGLVTGASLAELGHEILCVDIDTQKIKQLEEGIIPFYEPGLKELVQKNRIKKRLNFTPEIEQGVIFGEVIFNCVGTPSKKDGSADLSYVLQVAESVGKFAQDYKILVNKSTVPPGTARKCQELILKINSQSPVKVVSNPEFLAEGKAVSDFAHPDKIVFGAEEEKAFSILKKVYMGRMRGYIPVVETDWETAEMIKYANNSFLATKISFINEVANICDKVGADVRVVSQAMGMDYRINPRFLNAGIGYGGSCFPKDVRALLQVAKENNYEARLLQEVDFFNERQKQHLLTKIKKRFPVLVGKTFTLWGLSFKPKTSDMREAPSLVLIENLLNFGANVQVYDPIAMEEAKKILGEKVHFCSSAEEAVMGSSAILLVTEWDEFRNVDFLELGKQMKERVVFDGRNIYEPEVVREEGFEYFGMGRK